MQSVRGLVLAAGQGKRMNSPLPKVLHTAGGKPMLEHVLSALAGAGVTIPVVVVGHGADEVRTWIRDRASTALQSPQLGTGHAVMVAADQFSEFPGDLLITCGDTPLVSDKLFSRLISFHRGGGFSATILSAILDDPAAYGRIVRDALGAVEGIVEFRDASPEQRNIREINSGIYCFSWPELRAALGGLKNHNSQSEYYLTDAIALLRAAGKSVGALAAEDSREVLGVNTPEELAVADAILRERTAAASSNRST